MDTLDEARTSHDVLAIGNAIVDVLARVDDRFIRREDLAKGSMRLIDAQEAARLLSLLQEPKLISGGCAGNTAAGVASLGGRAAFVGKVADDELGHFYRHDMEAIGVFFSTSQLDRGAPTATSTILVTPDTERTMNTHLGACQELTPGDIDAEVVEGAAITYLEGFLWDPPKAKEAFREAAAIAHRAGRRVALTLSDSFCVDRYRDEFVELIGSGLVDTVFANEAEALALFETADLELALDRLGAMARTAAVTLGPHGSVVLEGGRRAQVAAPPVEHIVDKTGAGDLYAAGFLFGLARGLALEDCARIGSIAAGEVISHLGARPLAALRDLIERERRRSNLAA